MDTNKSQKGNTSHIFILLTATLCSVVGLFMFMSYLYRTDSYSKLGNLGITLILVLLPLIPSIILFYFFKTSAVFKNQYIDITGAGAFYFALLFFLNNQDNNNVGETTIKATVKVNNITATNIPYTIAPIRREGSTDKYGMFECIVPSVQIKDTLLFSFIVNRDTIEKKIATKNGDLDNLMILLYTQKSVKPTDETKTKLLSAIDSLKEFATSEKE
jgi:hypothetical protein